VPFQRERGRLKAFHRMAVFALVQIRRCGELPVMAIRMAISTFLELDLVNRFLALIDVAFGALYREVLALQRIVAGVVIFGFECRRLESVDRVAGRALNAQRPLGKLPVVRILVAIRTLGEGNLFLKVPALVARRTIHG